MKRGRVVLDMAVESGGNVEGSKGDEIVEVDGVKMGGISNLASKVAGHASYALSNNFNNGLLEFYDEESKNIRIDFEEEIISSRVLVSDGEVKKERFKQRKHTPHGDLFLFFPFIWVLN
jgi:NAD/NADP transhydrogenase alpha subunit